jgi:YVTN family beta-propeller protein
MRYLTVLVLALGLTVTVSPLLTAQSAPGALVVLSKGNLTLAVVDPVTLQVRGTAPSGPDPHETAVSADGRTAYVANYNGGGNLISVIDLVSMTAKPPIDLGALRAPHGVWFAAGKLWFTAETNKVIGTYDPAISAVDWVLGTGQNRTHMLIVTPDGQRVFTSNVNSATVSIIERTAPAARGGAAAAGRNAGPGSPAGRGRGAGGRGGGQPDWNVTNVTVGLGAEGFDLSPDGKELWVGNAQDGTVSVVNAAEHRVTETIPANVTGANRLKFTPDGRHVLVSSLRQPDVIVLDVATRREVKRIPIGSGAAGIQMQPDGARAYVACTADNYVAVIDLRTLEVTGRIDAGRQPDGLAWASR